MVLGTFTTTSPCHPSLWFHSHTRIHPSHHALCSLPTREQRRSFIKCVMSPMALSSLGFNSSFFQLASVRGTVAVAAGGGGKRRCVTTQRFTNMGHQEGVAGQLQDIHAVLLVISQATSNKGLGRKPRIIISLLRNSSVII